VDVLGFQIKLRCSYFGIFWPLFPKIGRNSIKLSGHTRLDNWSRKSEAYSITIFTAAIDSISHSSRAPVTVSHFHPSVIFESKGGAYPNKPKDRLLLNIYGLIG
jgi:hypothetical protein